MPPHRPQFPTSCQGISWLTTDDGSRTLWSDDFQESFHSGCGAVAESLVVYLKNSGVVELFKRRLPVHVLEVGLGTATDFLLTAALAEHFKTPLRYTALENLLIPAEILMDLHSGHLQTRAEGYCKNYGPAGCDDGFGALPELLEWLEETLACVSESGGGSTRFGKWVELDLVVGDALRYRAAERGEAGFFQAIYFDPFSPENAPDMWTPQVFAEMYSSLQVGGRLTTYCVKGSVRRDLEQASFTVEKQPGPVGGKREVLVAQK